MINWYLLIPLLLLGFILFAQNINSSKYKYLFRKTILSKSKKYELAQVLYGRVYYPRYFYIPSLKQYMVYSSLDETGDFRVYQKESKPFGKAYSLLDEKGNVITAFETPYRFSSRSGCLYGVSSYIPLLETGKTDSIPYHQIHNAALDLGSRDFEKLFIQLYTSSEYIEYVNLRVCGDQIHEAGIVCKRQGKIEILLAGVRDSRMICRFQENKETNNSDDYYVPDIKNTEKFPESEPALEIIPLETNDTNPFVHWRTGLHREFSIKKYINTYTGRFPNIFGVREVSGTVYVRFKTQGETFRIKILNVEKFGPAYNLGLRTFRLPPNNRIKDSLIFMESVQNCGDNRLGGGVFVVRPSQNPNPSADIPSDMTEKHFNTLPLTLQEALLDPEKTTSLKIYATNATEWFPEIERLKNLEFLDMETAITEIPDAISKLTKLKSLAMSRSNIEKISPKITELKGLEKLNLFSNKLTEFPSPILELENLRELGIGANKIAALPDGINKLIHLERLFMTSTNITSLPESMIGMKKLFIDDSYLKKKLPQEYKHLFELKKPEPK